VAAPDVYGSFFSAAGFSPHCEKISIKGVKPHTSTTKLKASRILTIKLD
jgi:hypothetical protein